MSSIHRFTIVSSCCLMDSKQVDQRSDDDLARTHSSCELIKTGVTLTDVVWLSVWCGFGIFCCLVHDLR